MHFLLNMVIFQEISSATFSIGQVGCENMTLVSHCGRQRSRGSEKGGTREEGELGGGLRFEICFDFHPFEEIIQFD